MLKNNNSRCLLELKEKTFGMVRSQWVWRREKEILLWLLIGVINWTIESVKISKSVLKR